MGQAKGVGQMGHMRHMGQSPKGQRSSPLLRICPSLFKSDTRAHLFYLLETNASLFIPFAISLSHRRPSHLPLFIAGPLSHRRPAHVSLFIAGPLSHGRPAHVSHVSHVSHPFAGPLSQCRTCGTKKSGSHSCEPLFVTQSLIAYSAITASLRTTVTSAMRAIVMSVVPRFLMGSSSLTIALSTATPASVRALATSAAVTEP